MSTTTAQQGFPIPTATDDPDIVGDLAALANAIEKRVAGVYNSIADRSARVASPQEGMVAFLKDTDAWTYYTGSAWAPMFAVPPNFSSGTAAPSGGVNGDVYFRTDV